MREFDNETFELMYEYALKAFNNAYTPYSHFNVGAAMLLKDGRVLTGSNIENASYGLTNCAERSCLFAAYSNGIRKDDIVKFMVIADCDRPVSPCGACRQVMSELMHKDVEVCLTNLKKDRLVMTVAELIPYVFTEDDL